MGSYTLTICRMVKNPDYNPVEARYGHPTGPEYIEDRQLACVITDTELEAIKHALVEVWK